jgi:ATP-binding cassette subfamily F protein 3
MDVLNEQNTVLEEAYSASPGYMPQETVRTILGAFLFTGDDVEKSVSVLSGGEKSRLILAKLLINPPNVLLLDEPTTHLDVDAVDVLVSALQSYNGTIIFISHDIHFVRSVANTVFEVKDGRVRKFPGSFDYYLEKKDTFVPLVQKAPKVARPEDKKLQEEKERLKKELAQKKEEEKRRKAYNEEIGRKIKKLEERKEKLSLESYAKSRALSDTRIYRDEETVKNYGRRLKEIQEELSKIDKEIDGLIAKLL